MPYHSKLLPDKIMDDGRKTLVINLNKTLINYEYKMGQGFEILKRPGLLRFLQEMSSRYEVVVFGTEEFHVIYNKFIKTLVCRRNMY
jgi:hypothetical protein